MSSEFRIKVCLDYFFDNYKSYSKLFIKKSIKTIGDLQQYISNSFDIDNFYLVSDRCYLPEFEDIRLLNDNDVIKVIPNKLAFKALNSDDEDAEKKRKKRKRKESSDALPVENKNNEKLIESTIKSLIKKKRKKDLNLVEKINYFETLQNPATETVQEDAVEVICDKTEKTRASSKVSQLPERRSILPTLKYDKLNNVIQTIIKNSLRDNEEKEEVDRRRENKNSRRDNEEKNEIGRRRENKNLRRDIEEKNEIDRREEHNESLNEVNECYFSNNLRSKDDNSQVCDKDIENIQEANCNNIETVEKISDQDNEKTPDLSNQCVADVVSSQKGSCDESIMSFDSSLHNVTRKRRRTRKRQKKHDKPAVPIQQPPVLLRPMNVSAKPMLHIRFDEEVPVQEKTSTSGIIECEKEVVENEQMQLESGVECNGTDVSLLGSENKNVVNILQNVIVTSKPATTIQNPGKDRFVVFKILKLDEKYTPTVSKEITGKILYFNTISQEVQILICSGKDEFEDPQGKFSLDDENCENTINVDENECLIKVLNWNELIQPSIF